MHWIIQPFTDDNGRLDHLWQPLFLLPLLLLLVFLSMETVGRDRQAAIRVLAKSDQRAG